MTLKRFITAFAATAATVAATGAMVPAAPASAAPSSMVCPNGYQAFYALGSWHCRAPQTPTNPAPSTTTVQ